MKFAERNGIGMKIGILTLHRVKNYGSVLQTYAVCEVLRKKGHIPIVIDYIPERMKPWPDLLYVRPDRYTIKGKKVKMLHFMFILASVIPRAYYYNQFRSFVKRRVTTTPKKYYKFDDLCNAEFDFDMYINGSDQIWNMDWENDIDRAYLLGFAPKDKPKGSFAASFGKKELTSREYEIMGEYLRDYSYISVRESTGLEILRKMGINSAKHILDPTLMLTKSDWSKIASKRLVKKKYLLVYQLQPESDLIKYAREIADKAGLIVVDFCRKFKCSPGYDKNLAFRKPEDFLSAIMYADFVVTDSFHCTAFSINFERRFLSLDFYYPERQRSLLNMLDLLDRFIPKNSNLDIKALLEEIDYERVNKKLNSERIYGDGFINEMLAELN